MSNNMNSNFQHFAFFAVTTLTTGALFGWAVLEQSIRKQNLVGDKYYEHGFFVCLCTFAFTGFLLHIKGLNLLLKWLKF